MRDALEQLLMAQSYIVVVMIGFCCLKYLNSYPPPPPVDERNTMSNTHSQKLDDIIDEHLGKLYAARSQPEHQDIKEMLRSALSQAMDLVREEGGAGAY